MEQQEIFSRFSYDTSNILALLKALQDNNPQNNITEEALNEADFRITTIQRNSSFYSFSVKNQ